MGRAKTTAAIVEQNMSLATPYLLSQVDAALEESAAAK
jgi:hypothetical protein